MRIFLFLVGSLSLCRGFTSLGVNLVSRCHAPSSSTALKSSDKPIAVVVQATIEPDRMAEFLKLIQTNAEETRKEPGCIRFDVLRSQEAPNEFFFYELYKDSSAIDYHKAQPHYNLWADFKATGGVIESVSYKTDAEFLT